jgi:Skp family chaperone for outer membrane proteins
MRYVKAAFFTVLVLFVGAMILAACGKKAPETMTPTAVVSEFSVQKEQYVRDLEGKINEYQAKIDELRKKAETMTGKTKEDIDQKIGLLMAKQEEAKGKLEAIKATGEEAWETAKAETDVIVKDLETLYNDVLSLVK